MTPLTIIPKIALFIRENRLPLVGLFIGALLPLLLFGLLSQSIHGAGGLWWDQSFLQFVHRYSTSRLDSLVAWLTIVGGVLAMPAILGFALLLRLLFKQPRAAFFFSASIAGAGALNIVAKLAFHRVRPALWKSPLPESDYSFPSGHAMISMALATTLVLLAWPTRLRWAALICALSGVVGVGLSRLYLGVHFPSDILAGWCASLIWVSGVYWLAWRGSSQWD
jgi:membrane-associated phospholipid phosphatase